MGCGASAQLKVKKNRVDPDISNNQESPCDKMMIKQKIGASPLLKNKSLNIADKSEQHAKTGEEPAHPLPEGDYGDMKLGITDAEKFQMVLDSLEPGELFCDSEFETDEHAIYYNDESSGYADRIEWLRPKDIVEEPHLLIDGMSKDDIKQGTLGDCWFLSSCAAVSREERFMSRICPNDFPLSGEGYRGVAHFCFWRFGNWVDVYVDDRLPTRDGQLVFAHCETKEEFWVALIEKAYAKLHGSYEAIEGGQTMDALVDLTGGLAERYEIKGVDPSFYKHILSANKAGSFIACSRKGDWKNSNQAEANGLVAGHAYTVTDAVKVRHKMGTEKLLRIRNPWGNETEWKGAWSDNDDHWNLLDEEKKKKIAFTSKADGEFWMSFRDFCIQFQEITICTLGPDFDGDGKGDHPGHVELIRGEWTPGLTAGGSRNDLESFAKNPQYLLTLHSPDDFDPLVDDPDARGKCSVVIALMQEHRRSQRHLGVKTLQIGFILYQVTDPATRLKTNHFRYKYDAGRSGVYINYREVSSRFELDPGHYVIIPSTFSSNDSGSFLIRAFAQKQFSLSGPLR
ncbi:calpain-A-like [Watersipora subatra]|uniref:calpain-A-like n=1 Tax=Watersipora subatra TaxID=2589382 RepID=UPI00355B374F